MFANVASASQWFNVSRRSALIAAAGGHTGGDFGLSADSRSVEQGFRGWSFVSTGLFT